MLEVRNVSKRFGAHQANAGVSISARPGRIFGLLGPNGAGKTTLIRMITNIIEPDEGEIFLDNAPVGELAQERIGYLPEERGLYKKLSVGDQLAYFARLKGMSNADSKARISEWLHKLDADGWETKKVQELSKGMQQKVQFISTVVHNPRLVILDEPFSGLDPVNAQLLINAVQELRKADTTILLSTHQMEQVEKLCDDIALINRGRVVLADTLQGIKSMHRSDRVVIEFDSATSSLPAIDGVSIISTTEHRAELQLTDPSVSPNSLLQSLIPHVSITKFEVTEPTLHEIFVKTVTGQDAV
ncbi:MAG: ATP-binding cassette domain-containing protein [Bradyrhizobiaceae bacterium]|nr:ATP-binding cassette domain-containing protein [Bradyrhizobiaceae bacterium]